MPMSLPFDTLLIANRGEIAIRIMRAARSLGLRTVAVYSDADRDAPHVVQADTAVRIGPAAAAQSYLSVPALLAAAATSGAQAVHPGYGFLSEQAMFASACIDAGLTFVGPDPAVIDLLGRKDAARNVAKAAAVPVLPAIEAGQDAELIERAAEEVGFPLLVKAVAGGGGKGMRIVASPDELATALASARRESKAAFGDDSVLLERYVPFGRHIEVQVFADRHGTVLHMYERDCSVQRRHQKIIEEAPAPLLSSVVRDELTSAAVRLARKVGYVNAGTVEFLVAGPEMDEVYFLEMNTRLQVEHPVTEIVTGIDLVQLQLIVAAGLPIPLTQQDIKAAGSAIEVRVYAEDADNGFLPQAGRAELVRWPERARVDAALETGQVIGTAYDPMLGKIIAMGPTREGARRNLLEALDDTAIFGLTTNLGFLRRLVASEAFARAAIDTTWLDRSSDVLPSETPHAALVGAGWVLATSLAPDHAREPFALGDGWRLGGPPAPIVLELDHHGFAIQLRVEVEVGVVTELLLHSEQESATGHTAVRSWSVREVASSGDTLRLDIDGVLFDFTVLAHGSSGAGGDGVTIGVHGQAHTFRPRDTTSAAAAESISDGSVTAPMPGVVRDVLTEVGGLVRAGDVLAVMEAMKMELPVLAPMDGVIIEAIAAGQQVELHQRLFLVEAKEGVS